LTAIAWLALIQLSGVIMISSPHCPAPVPRIGSLSRLASSDYLITNKVKML